MQLVNNLIAILGVGLLSVAAIAQTSQQQTPGQSDESNQQEIQAREPIRVEVAPTERPKRVVGSDGVIRLEATIRGDQQQPRILSIVPWDSPAHRRISRVALTGEISDSMTPIHRHAFLQRITLHDQLKAAIPTEQTDGSAQRSQ